jgi:hypothetical protein
MIASQCEQHCIEAEPRERRMINQGLFKKLYIAQDGTVERFDLTQPFVTLLDRDLLRDLARARAAGTDSGRAIGRGCARAARPIAAVERAGRQLHLCTDKHTAGRRGRSAGFARAMSGAPGRIRTCDLPLRRRLLYPLSYEGPAVRPYLLSPRSRPPRAGPTARRRPSDTGGSPRAGGGPRSRSSRCGPGVGRRGRRIRATERSGSASGRAVLHWDGPVVSRRIRRCGSRPQPGEQSPGAPVPREPHASRGPPRECFCFRCIRPSDQRRSL